MPAHPPPPRDVHEHKSGSRQVDHLQLFSIGGELIAESFWQPTGRYRLCVGWFGIPRVEEEQQAFDSSPHHPTIFRWRRVPRGQHITLFKLNLPPRD